MSDEIKHECGIAMIRLLKPLSYYREKYGTPFYGLNKLCLLMEKQHNRGQDGAGMANIKFDMEPGKKYISIQKSNSSSPIRDIFQEASAEIAKVCKQPDARPEDCDWLKENARFTGELFLGHLRYGTYGGNGIERCHPFLRESNWMSKTLLVAGNFNLTNTDTLFQRLVELGQHPKDRSDTVTVLEKIGNYLDRENERMEVECLQQGMTNREASAYIARNLDLARILRKSCVHWDGGYVIAGVIGHGDAFVLRDPCGIRPAFYYTDDEVAIVTSERPVIQTVFNVPFERVQELPPGNAIIIRRDGDIRIEDFSSAHHKPAQCSFERIYFSRGTDADIYQERKNLGRHLVPKLLDAVDCDMENTVFSFIPNTAENCFYGLMESLREHCSSLMAKRILELPKDQITPEAIHSILAFRPRFEKVAVKDAKLRTFIAADSSRDDLVTHVYDVTYGTVHPGRDTLVVIDDSIVRGTTMRESILKILDRLSPKRIVLASSAPQIRYPDCYGIDMAKLGDFVAFRAAVELLKETNNRHILDTTYKNAKEALARPDAGDMPNYVKDIYAPFTAEQISCKIGELLRPSDIRAEVTVIFQTIEGLHESCPRHTGDWYFTGNYPTPGGARVCNRAFVNFIEGKNERAY